MTGTAGKAVSEGNANGLRNLSPLFLGRGGAGEARSGGQPGGKFLISTAFFSMLLSAGEANIGSASSGAWNLARERAGEARSAPALSLGT